MQYMYLYMFIRCTYLRAILNTHTHTHIHTLTHIYMSAFTLNDIALLVL